MDIKVVFVFTLVFYTQSDGFVSAISLRRLSEKIDSIETILEKRLELEITQRHKDYDNILSKLDIITTKIEKLEERSSTSGTSTSDAKNIGANENNDSYKADTIHYLITGIKAEKKLNKVMRQDMSKMGRMLNDLNSRMTREVARVDNRISESNFEMKEHIDKLSNNIEIGFNSIMVRQNETENVIRDDLVTLTSPLISAVAQFNSASEGQYLNLSNVFNIKNDQILTAVNDSQKVLQNELENFTKKHCNKNNETTDSLIKQMWSNMSASFKDVDTKLPYFESCKDALSRGHRTSGVYIVHRYKVWCDQITEGGGWTVFQRRMDGSVDFYRDWASYKLGFGDLSGEFWLGNDYLSEMLSVGSYELRVDLEDFEGNLAYAKYNSFRIDTESNNYTLHIGKFSGNASDSLEYHNGQAFSTKDKDLDKYPGSCAKDFKGAWWYRYCHFSNLNGLYHVPPGNGGRKNVVWGHWKSASLKFVEMKFR